MNNWTIILRVHEDLCYFDSMYYTYICMLYFNFNYNINHIYRLNFQIKKSHKTSKKLLCARWSSCVEMVLWNLNISAGVTVNRYDEHIHFTGVVIIRFIHEIPITWLKVLCVTVIYCTNSWLLNTTPTIIRWPSIHVTVCKCIHTGVLW